MKEIKITCDACGEDLIESAPGYRLCLTAEAKKLIGNTMSAVMVYPPIKRDYHFCGFKCLIEWIKKEPHFHGQLIEREEVEET